MSSSKINMLLSGAFLWLSISHLCAGHIYKMSEDEEIHMLPLVKCTHRGLSIETIEKSCLEQCPRSEKKATVTNMRVYDIVQPENKLMIFVCQTFKETWNFDESWLLSKSKNLQERTTVSANTTECKELYNSVCHSKPCSTKPKKGINEEYSYASSITKQFSYSSGAVLNMTAIILEQGERLIHNLPGVRMDIKLDSGSAVSDDQKTYYLWNPISVSECPLKRYQVTQCMIQPSRSIICPDLGLNVWEPHHIKIKMCSSDTDYFTDDKGIILKEAPKDEKLHRSRYIDLTGERASVLESNMVSMMNEALRIRDELSCDHQCLELINSKHVEDSIISTSNSFWRYSRGHFYECHPLFNCNFEKSPSICLDPFDIEVVCNGEILHWSPEKDYAISPSPCASNRKSYTSYRMRTSRRILLMNQTGVYLDIGENETSYVKHMSPHLTTLKARTVKDFFQPFLSDDRSKEVETRELSKDVKSQFWKMVEIPGHIIEWIEDTENDFKKILSLIVGLIMIIFAYYFLRKGKQLFFFRHHSHKSQERVYNVIRKNERDHEIYEI
ncbi:TPA_asm: G [Corylus betacytorhabdovirus 1]|nr:TPA_asm: G [Corylus betacytorhabdovirus 1]